jgi:hypothetical protein
MTKRTAMHGNRYCLTCDDRLTDERNLGIPFKPCDAAGTEQRTMNTKHTPGPWMAVNRFIGYIDGPTQQFCTIAETPKWDGESYAEADANARLIAAAPELLSVAKTLLLYVETYGGEVTKNIAAALPLYRAAIAKATGQGEG